MLNCKDVADRSSALIDAELSTWQVIRVRLHLAICKGCRRFVEQVRATNHLTAQAAELDSRHTPPDIDERHSEILAMLRKGQTPR